MTQSLFDPARQRGGEKGKRAASHPCSGQKRGRKEPVSQSNDGIPSSFRLAFRDRRIYLGWRQPGHMAPVLARSARGETGLGRGIFSAHARPWRPAQQKRYGRTLRADSCREGGVGHLSKRRARSGTRGEGSVSSKTLHCVTAASGPL